MVVQASPPQYLGGFMISTLKATFFLAIIFLTAGFVQAQDASLVHFFPQVGMEWEATAPCTHPGS
jgi:hypothetical protein